MIAAHTKLKDYVKRQKDAGMSGSENQKPCAYGSSLYDANC